MMEYNKAVIGSIAKENGFVRDTFEKVLRLKNVLKFINEHGYLKEHLALKGGTAINMTIFNLPRLSVDIDLDYIPNSDKTEMEYDREKISEIIKEYMAEEGYTLSPSSRFSHSLDAFYYQYQNTGGNKDVLKIEINYSLRAHVFEPTKRKVLSDIFDDELEVLTLAPMEIFAAKANALINRAAARDLYDFNNMTFLGLFDELEEEMFRKCIVFYNTISQETVNKSFDTSAIDKLTFVKIRRDLFPVIRNKEHFDMDARKQNAKEYIHGLMQLTEQELQYMTEFENKNYKPELLFDDKEILERIKAHPMAIWKCQNK